jgi:hypothetical protein
VTGWACEVCGKQLGPAPGAATVASALEGLEPTQLPPDGLGLAIEPAPGLEPTASSPVPEIPGEPLLGWEATYSALLPDVGAGGLDDMDPGRAAPEGPPVAVPTVATCRYCRNVQASGLFCDRCGMRLPWAAPAASAAPVDSAELRHCKRCGERSPASMERCGGCGALLATES